MKKQFKNYVVTLLLLLSIFLIMGAGKVSAATQAEALVEKAKSQLGVKERSAGSDDISYNDWYYGRRVNNNGVSGKYAWCAVFVSWCAKEAGIPESIIPKDYNTTSMKNRLIQNGGVPHLRTSGYKPVKGDIIFFGSNASTHVGIVDYTSGNTIYYIDGNNTQTTPHGVHYSSRTFDRTDVWGFVTPKYSGSVSDSCNCSTSYAGTYIVNTQSLPLTMRSGHGTGYSQITTIPKGTKVTVTKANGTWAHVSWNGYSGYCAMEYLKKSGAAPTGYNIAISSTSVYDGEPFTIKITPWGEGITNYKLYIVQSNGNVSEYDMGNNNTLNAVLRIVGNYKIYAKVTNAYGSYTGSVTNGSLSLEIKKVTLSEVANVGEEYYGYIKNNAFGTALTNDGSNVSSRKYTGAVNQLWHITRRSDGSYQIISCVDGKSLDADSAKGISGTNVQVYYDNDTSAQRWYLHATGSNTYYFRPQCSDTCVLDIYGNTGGEGVNVNLWTKNGSAGQQFSIVKYSEASISGDKTTLNLDLCKNKSGIVKITAKGYLPNAYILNSEHNTTALDVTCGGWNNQCATLTITGKKTGEYTAKIRLLNSSTKECWCTKDIKVNITCSHSYGAWTTTKEATCTTDGIKSRKCTVCGKVETATVAMTGHQYTVKVIEATCRTNGYTSHVCTKCNDSYNDHYTALKEHTYGQWIVEKELTNQTIMKHICSVCEKTEYKYVQKENEQKDEFENENIDKGEDNSKLDEELREEEEYDKGEYDEGDYDEEDYDEEDYDEEDVEYEPVELSECSLAGIKESYTYTGKKIKPSLRIKDGDYRLEKDEDYTVSYQNNKNIGKATITIKGKGDYTGTIQKTFRIIPKKLTIQRVKRLVKGFRLNLKKDHMATGYQIQYSLKANMKNRVSKKTKKNVFTQKNLESGKNYYIRVRAYVVIENQTYYGTWSKVRRIKTR